MENGGNKTGNGTLQTVDRALDILEYMAGVKEPQSLGTLSAEFGRSKATMHRILKSLTERGFLVRSDDRGFYRFGWACSHLANEARQGISLTELCLPYMRELLRRTQETVYLVLYQGGQAVAVESLQSPKPVAVMSVLGEVLPVYAVSGALVLLAYQPDVVIQRVLKAPLPIYTPKTITDPSKMWEIIWKIRHDGFAVNREGYRPGVCGIAAPCRLSSEGPVIAAISVCMPRTRFELLLKDDVLWATLKDDVLWAARSTTDILEGYVDERAKRVSGITRANLTVALAGPPQRRRTEREQEGRVATCRF